MDKGVGSETSHCSTTWTEMLHFCPGRRAPHEKLLRLIIMFEGQLPQLTVVMLYSTGVQLFVTRFQVMMTSLCD